MPVTNNLPANQNPTTPPIVTLRDLLQKSEKQIQTALPKHMTAERMIRIAVTACQRTPELMKCSPVSIVGCVVQAAELGLELSGPLGQAYLIPRWNKNTRCKEATFQIGYRGLVELAQRSGRIASFPAHVVYENDQFTYAYGTRPFLKHIPTMGEQGKPIAAYAVLNLKDGGCDFEVMSTTAINAHRKQYSESSSYSPWDSAWDEMAKKTVIKKLAKRAPMSIELTKAALLDEYGEAGVQQLDSTAKLSIDEPSRAKQLTDKLSEANPANQEQQEADPLPVDQNMVDEWQQSASEAVDFDQLDRLDKELSERKENMDGPTLDAVSKILADQRKRVTEARTGRAKQRNGAA